MKIFNYLKRNLRILMLLLIVNSMSFIMSPNLCSTIWLSILVCIFLSIIGWIICLLILLLIDKLVENKNK
jgi:hypothetical protein